MEISKQKSLLRKELLSRRESLGKEEWSTKSEKAINNLYALDIFQKAETVHCFISMNERKEVNTHNLLRDMLENRKKVIVPVTDFETVSLKHVELLSFQNLKTNKWGVPEPAESQETDLVPELIVVPLLAADKEFNRLGYGKGFYDRFLQKVNVPKAGLLFEEFILDYLPVEPFDEKLDILITEKGVYRRNNESL